MQSKSIAFHSELLKSSSHSDYAITNKLTPFISMQNHYNLLYREEEREMMPTLSVSL
jgi:aryl-alcohol dehydrogenase-like predicted oxidoreductase